MVDAGPEQTLCHCNGCTRETWHDVLSRFADTRDETIGLLRFKQDDTFELLRCRGCTTICSRHTHTIYGDAPRNTWTFVYPPPIARSSPDWYDKLPGHIWDVLGEIYKALQSERRRLAVIGAKTVIDMVIVDRIGGDVGSFVKKLQALQELGAISPHEREILAVALDTGNAVAHRGLEMTDEQVTAVIDIVEHLLASTYHPPALAEDLKRSTPPRP